MEFTQALRERIQVVTGQQKAPWGDINPLVLIGLSQAVLDSGATPDGIYRAIRAYSRQVAADVSPDRNPKAVSGERLRQINEAFDYIDDRTRFDLALKDFKTLKAEDRHEAKLLRQTLSALRAQIVGFESQFEQLLVDQRKHREEKQLFEKQKREEPALVPELEEKIASLQLMLKVEIQSSRDSTHLITLATNKAATYQDRLIRLQRRYDDLVNGFLVLRQEIDPVKENLRTERRNRNKIIKMAVQKEKEIQIVRRQEKIFRLNIAWGEKVRKLENTLKKAEKWNKKLPSPTRQTTSKRSLKH